jgi:plasmid stabilization system protein ParE
VISYEVRVDAVRILRVLHARRDNDHLDFGQVA